jgi:hypothetical protein
MGSLLSWDDVTIRQFQQISEINTELDSIERDMWILSILHGKEFEYFETLPIGELAALIKKLEWMAVPIQPAEQKPFKAGRRRFKLTVNRNELLAHQNAAVQKLWGEGGVKNLHFVLSYLSVELDIFGKPKKVKDPHHEFEKLAELFLDTVSIETAMGHMLFFSSFLTASLRIILPFLGKEVERLIGESGLPLLTSLQMETP